MKQLLSRGTNGSSGYTAARVTMQGRGAVSRRRCASRSGRRLLGRPYRRGHRVGAAQRACGVWRCGALGSLRSCWRRCSVGQTTRDDSQRHRGVDLADTSSPCGRALRADRRNDRCSGIQHWCFRCAVHEVGRLDVLLVDHWACGRVGRGWDTGHDVESANRVPDRDGARRHRCLSL